MTVTSVVGTKGQIVIEKAIRDALSVRPGQIAVQRVVGDRVEITFLEPEHDRSLRGILAPATARTVPDGDWPAALERAWADAARDAATESGVDG
jgi:bifunctional DNA-binding transcriptional regulator/antitoxin component of YhaV-PrlF toxin-antitoxin module